MKKPCLLFAICCSLFALAPQARAAVSITKAEPVAAKPQDSGGMMSGNSLVPTALGLVTSVMALNKQMQTLKENCIPTDAEVNFVSNTMKEFAKTGAPHPDMRGRDSCRNTTGNFRITAEQEANSKGLKACYDTWSEAGTVWDGYPRASKAQICRKNGGVGCGPKDLEYVSDIYEVFALIDFGPRDYLPGEATLAAKLMEKYDECAPSEMSDKARKLWGEFLMGTMGSLGQKQNAGDVMGQVSGIVQSGRGSPLQSIMGMAPALTGGLMK